MVHESKGYGRRKIGKMGEIDPQLAQPLGIGFMSISSSSPYLWVMSLMSNHGTLKGEYQRAPYENSRTSQFDRDKKKERKVYIDRKMLITIGAQAKG